jgi:prepilin-type N-terminal cleavage/methylation domain-containing protein
VEYGGVDWMTRTGGSLDCLTPPQLDNANWGGQGANVMKNTHARKRTGFTLIELIAVIVVLAILAGVAMPKYFDYADKAKESATKGTLGGVRAGIANYYANTAIAGAATYPTLSQLTSIGTVMQEPIPDNPYKNAGGIRAATWNEASPPVDANAAEGWNYDAATGKFWANSSTGSHAENTW